MLRGIANDGHDDHPDEEVLETEGRPRGRQRADEQFAFDRDEGRRHDQDAEGEALRPPRLLDDLRHRIEDVAMRAKGEQESQAVGHEEDPRDAEAHFLQGDVLRGPGRQRVQGGITRAITATTNIVTWIPDASREKVCDLWRNPPASMLTPRTRRTFPMIEPVREALTTSVRPLDRAKIAMISSVALPKVALRRPPTPGPACLPSSSVASPRNQASGTIAIPAAANTIAAGPNITSRIQLRGTKRPRRTAQVYGRRGPRSIAGGTKPPFLTSRPTFN